MADNMSKFFGKLSKNDALTKTIVFAFVITSISAFYGYYVNGGSVEVGRNSTKAVITGSIVILITNYLLTQWLLF